MGLGDQPQNLNKMDQYQLCFTLENVASEVLRRDIMLMDNHHAAPGYILFASQEEGKYISYLVWTPSKDSPFPFCHAFQLTAEMDVEGVKQAVVNAQNKFIADVSRFQHAGGKRVAAIQGQDCIPQEWFGGSLSHFGMNPYGKEKYRVVYAPTRMYLVGGRWQDREQGKIVRTVDEYRWIPRYQDTEGWVLEKWLSAEQFAGSKQIWEAEMDADTGLYPLGPYPERGEFESCYTWPLHPPTSAVEQIIQMLEYGKQHYRPRDIAQAHMEAITGRKAEEGKRMEDMLKDAMPAFWGKAISGNPQRKTVDHDSDFRLTADDVSRKMGDSGFQQVDPKKVN